VQRRRRPCSGCCHGGGGLGEVLELSRA
jgi:hypothetical protein